MFWLINLLLKLPSGLLGGLRLLLGREGGGRPNAAAFLSSPQPLFWKTKPPLGNAGYSKPYRWNGFPILLLAGGCYGSFQCCAYTLRIVLHLVCLCWQDTASEGILGFGPSYNDTCGADNDCMTLLSLQVAMLMIMKPLPKVFSDIIVPWVIIMSIK